MKLYGAHLKPGAEPVLVREGFSWGALAFGPFWLASHRAWVPACVSLAAYVLVLALAAGSACFILVLGLALILGLTGNDMVGWALGHKGYLLAHVLGAADSEEALGRLLTYRPDLANRFRPDGPP